MVSVTEKGEQEMIQDKLIEGRAYWVKAKGYAVYFLSPSWWIVEGRGVWFTNEDDPVSQADAEEWIIIPTAEEISACRAGDCHILAEMQSDENDMEEDGK
jgi:hypothetical protein